MQSDKDVSKWSVMMGFTHVLDHVFHGLIFALLLYIVYIPIAYYRHLLSWHAILGTIGFLLLMSESITIFSDNSWYIKIARNRKIIIHGIVFALATGFAILSTCFEYYRKATRKGHGHFDSFHGVFALLATICAVLACISGLAVANTEWCQKYILQIRPVVLKLSHNVMGLISYILGMLSLCCAYYSNWFISRTYLGERIVLVILTLSLTLYTLKSAFMNMRSQIISLQD